MTSTCRIQWIDEQGRPTPDTKPAIGRVRRVAHQTALDTGGTFSCPASEWFPICADHYAQYLHDNLANEHWEFETTN